MTLGERIKQVRTFLGYTQEELANLVGISRVSIGNYERNTRIPDGNTLKNISIALETTTDYLLGKLPPSNNPTHADFATGAIYHNYSSIEDEDYALQEYLSSKGYKITPSIFSYTEEELSTDKYTYLLNAWKNPSKQYYILSRGKETFFTPPKAISEFESNISKAIEFEWFKLKEKYANYKPPTTE